MVMPISKISLLAALLQEYYESGELLGVADLFGITLPTLWPHSQGQEWLAVAREMVTRLDQGNFHALLHTVLDQLAIKNVTAIANTNWERRTAHERLRSTITELRTAFDTSGTPGEIAVLEGSPFSAKSQLRELLATASTALLIVDPYIGAATLDCLRSVTTPIRLLTSGLPSAIESGFASVLSDFRKEGFQIQVRQVAMLHDRHLVFNDRCWLVGSSLKDAGKKAFHCMEVVDLKADVVHALEVKWSASTLYS
jgi:hypothetical protein